MSLSPEDKLIALYLFTGQSNRIGLFNFSPGEAAEDLSLNPETFAEGFEKVCQTLNFGWDKNFRVLYLPTWWKYNCPENPNVLKSCLSDLHEIPKTGLISEFSSNLTFLPETFHEIFAEGLGKPPPKRMPNQEQEQEQDIKSGAKAPCDSSPSRREGKLTRPDPETLQAFDRFYQAYPRHVGKADALKAWLKLQPSPEINAKIMDGVSRYIEILKDTDPKFIKHPGPWLNARRWEDEPVNGNRHQKPEAKNIGNGMVEVDGRQMDRKTYERRYGQPTN